MTKPVATKRTIVRVRLGSDSGRFATQPFLVAY